MREKRKWEWTKESFLHFSFPLREKRGFFCPQTKRAIQEDQVMFPYLSSLEGFTFLSPIGIYCASVSRDISRLKNRNSVAEKKSNLRFCMRSVCLNLFTCPRFVFKRREKRTFSSFEQQVFSFSFLPLFPFISSVRRLFLSLSLLKRRPDAFTNTCR